MENSAEKNPSSPPVSSPTLEKKAAEQKKKPKRSKGPKRKRTNRPYPASSFKEALELAEQIQRFAMGERVRRLTLFKEMDKSPTSSSSQMLITNSNKYGITTGSYVAEWLELTPAGKIASNLSISAKERLQARFQLAIASIPPFKALYDEYRGRKLPSHEIMKDFLHSTKSGVEDLAECIDLFIVNAKDLGLLQTIAGSETLLPIEQILDELKEPTLGENSNLVIEPRRAESLSGANGQAEKAAWSTICFYIAPIGSEGSEARKHSDLFLNSIVEPALKDFGLSVIRADKIGESGLITAQVLEHLLKAKLVIVDLSFHNPNVFYELAVRHASKLPIVQIIRKSDRIPFDVDQVRTIQIDTTDIYSLVPKLETHRSEIATHVRQVLASPDNVSNPLTIFCPGFHVSFPKS